MLGDIQHPEYQTVYHSKWYPSNVWADIRGEYPENPDIRPTLV
jgi:hypothetical protein